MSKIISIGTAVPAYRHQQSDIMAFMQNVYAGSEAEKRKMRFLYGQSGIEARYSVLSDYSRPVNEWRFYPQSESLEPFPSLEQRLTIYNKKAPLLSVEAIRNCLHEVVNHKEVTHLITVSCTGMSAPGLDLQVTELMDFDKNIFRTSLNFMGCYAAIHALRLGDALCAADPKAKVLIVCTELCTLHFQREAIMDNIASSLLFGDGSSAVLLAGDESTYDGLYIDGFYSEVVSKGKGDMAWELSSTGFLMTLSGYVPELIQQDFKQITEKAMLRQGASTADISHWCIHPGGKRILEVIEKCLQLNEQALIPSYKVLNDVGNLSSATLLFVLKNILDKKQKIHKLFGAAFGPGLTVETFTAHN